jgi:DNA-binding SARP family transcriptional activator
MFIDRLVLMPRVNTTIDVYLSNISREDKEILSRISVLDAVDIDFVDKIYNSAGLLKMLSDKGEYVFTRDIKYFRISPALRSYFSKNIALEEPEIKAIKKQYGRHLADTGHYYGSLTLFASANDIEGFNKSIEHILRDLNLLSKGIPYVKKHPYYELKIEESKLVKYPYFTLYKMISSHIHNDTNVSFYYDRFDDVIEVFKNTDERAYLVSLLTKIRILISRGEIIESKKYFDRVIKYKSSDAESFIFALACTLPNVIVNTNITIEDMESYAFTEGIEENFWYIRLMEEIAKAYYKQGNYKNALNTVKIIKNYLNYYIIPPYFIAPHYFAGEVAEAMELVDEALNWPNPLKKGLNVLYTIKGMICHHYGNVNEAIEYYDKAYKSLNIVDDDYYTTITQRCLFMAKIGKAQYAKDLANIYLQDSIIRNKEAANGLLLSISYAYFKMDDKKRSFYYATECVKNSTAKSYVWLLGMGIIVNIMLSRSEIDDDLTLIKNLLKASYFYGMKMIVVDSSEDIFSPILQFAKKNELETKYVEQIELSIKEKESFAIVTSPIKINMFGNVTVLVNDNEIKWKTRKSKELFILLYLAGDKGISRTSIIKNLWKGREKESAINNLKTTNNIIRNTLKEYDIRFSIEYINAKYILKIDNVESDYEQYIYLSQQYSQETTLSQRLMLMTNIINLCKDGFASDLRTDIAKKERDIIKQWIIVNLFQLVETLIKSNNIADAKRFLMQLIDVDRETDYTNFIEIINTNITTGVF